MRWKCSAISSHVIALVFAGARLHGDDTHVPVLAKGQTDLARSWVYVRDDRPFGGTAPPAAVFYYSRDRSSEHPQTHLAKYSGVLQADAFGGYNKLYEPDRMPGPIAEAACWAHYLESEFMLSIASQHQYWPMPTGCRTRHKSRLHGTMRRRERKCPCRSRFRYRPVPRCISRTRAGAVSNCPAARYILPVAAHLPAMAAMDG
jgi:hypothetical protein